MSNTFDVIVIGAGPAGNYVAKDLSIAGLNVAVFEKDREIGVPVRCGEAVGEGGLSLAMDKSEISRDWIDYEIHGGMIVSPSGIHLPVYTDDVGYILDRKKFDKYFATVAMDSGAQYFMKSFVKDVIKDGDKIVGVEVLHYGELKQFYAPIIVAADGVESVIAKRAGINSTLALKDIEVCAQYYVGNLEAKEDLVTFFTGSEVAPGGYAWAFPKSKNTANIGIGVSGTHAMAGVNPKDYLDKLMRRYYPDVQPLNFVVGSVPVSKRLDSIVEDNIMLVGDAARQINPLAGGGITYGINAAKMLSKRVVEYFASEDKDLSILKKYEEDWDSTIGKQQNRSYKLKEGVSKITDETLNSAAAKLEGKKNLTYGKVFKTLLFKQPSLALTAVQMFMK